MVQGSCLCGGVTFEIERAEGPFELCHCSRCRKSSGSAFVAGLGVRVEDFRLISGRELISRFVLPVRETPPGYGRFFCRRCGCAVPDPEPSGEWFEVPAGLLDGEPGVSPDRHIYVDGAARWSEELDRLPRLTKSEIRALRAKARDSRQRS